MHCRYTAGKDVQPGEYQKIYRLATANTIMNAMSIVSRVSLQTGICIKFTAIELVHLAPSSFDGTTVCHPRPTSSNL